MTCSVAGCGKPHLARGWCNQHYIRWRIHGDVSVNLNRKEVVGYSAAHSRLGPVTGQCRCGGTPTEWSYIGGDPNELTGTGKWENGLKYSLDSSFYQPLCGNCHRRYDRLGIAHPVHGEDHPLAKLNEEAVLWIRENPQVSLSACARKYGVTVRTISLARRRVTWKHI